MKCSGTLVHSAQMADALLVAGIAAGAAAVGAVAGTATARATSRKAPRADARQTLQPRTYLEAIERTSAEERRSATPILDSMVKGSCWSSRTAVAFREPRARTPRRRRPRVLDALFPMGLREAGAGATRERGPLQRRGRDGRPRAGSARRDPRRRRRIGPAGGARRHRDPRPRGRPAGLRHERLARAEDAGGIDPGGRRDHPRRRARRSAAVAPLRRTARARGGPAVTHRLGPARPLAPGERERARGGGGPGRRRCATRPSASRTPPPRPGSTLRVASDAVPPYAARRGTSRSGAQPHRQRGPLHAVPAAGSTFGLGPRTGGRAGRVADTGVGHPAARSRSRSSSGSTGWTARAPARPAARGSDCRS